jgi:hypothetical protein
MSDDITYEKIKDNDGKDFLCPITSKEAEARRTLEELEDCFEKNVTERYSGNYDIAD